MNASQAPTPRLAFIHQLSDNQPQALAWVRGGDSFPSISGLVKYYDKRFRVRDLIGHSVIIHSLRDDFTSQPSGDPGTMIACSTIFSE